MAAKAELELRELLLMTGCVQPVKVDSKGNRVFALCREVHGQAKAWLANVEKLLHIAEDNDIPLHLCRQYVLKNGQMVFGWHVAIDAKSAEDLKRCLGIIRLAMDTLGPDLGPAEELVIAAPDGASKAVPPPAAPKLKAAAPEAQESAQEAAGEPADDEEDLEAPLPEEVRPKLTPAQQKELAERRQRYLQRTSAPPRAPDPAVDPPEPAVDYTPQVVFRGRAKDAKNRMVPVVIEEMQLPHVFVPDMNVPNEKGRGAKTL